MRHTVLTRFAAKLRRDRRGVVSVEMALVSTLFLLPLLFLACDGLFVLSARYQTNAALLSLYDYAWSNPSQAANTASIDTILTTASKTSVVPIALPAGFSPTLTYACVQTDGSSTPATATTNQSTGSTTETCNSGTLATSVAYQVTASVSLPFPIPGVASPLILSAAGTVQAH